MRLSRRSPRLNRRNGLAMTVWVIASMPLCIVLLAWIFNGFSAALHVRRAISLSTVAVQAGSARVENTGAGVQLAGDSCARAIAMACQNATCNGDTVDVTCTQTGNRLRVVTVLKPPYMLEALCFGGEGPSMRAVITGGPHYGIETEM
jgi:hypothetical protein